MSFLNGWVAAGIAAVVIPTLLILYFLKLRRREQVVPSTLLWKRAVQDLQVNAPFQRLRKNLLLFLQLLILGAALFALARPIVQTKIADAARVVLLIDNSASMNAHEPADGKSPPHDSDPTRLDLAKEQAERLVRTFNRDKRGWRALFSLGGAKADTQVMVIAFSDQARFVSQFTTNTDELADLIRGIQPTDRRTDLREALSLAEAYMAPPARLTSQMEGAPAPASGTPGSPESAAKLVLISDGRIANLDKVVLRNGSMDLLQIGQTADNVGITVLRAQRNYERPESVEVFMTVRNFGPAPVETDVSFYVDGGLRTVRTVRLAGRPASLTSEAPAANEPNASEPTSRSTGAAPAGKGTKPSEPADEGSSQSLSFALDLEQAALLEARLSRPDALAVDNTASAVVPPPRRQRVLVVTDGKYPFLNAVMPGLPLAEYPFVTPAQYEAGEQGPYEENGQSTYDLVVFDKYLPDKLPAGNYLFLGVVPKLKDVTVGETLENPPLIWWDETHPVLRHVPLYSVYVKEAKAVKVPPQAEVLIEGPAGPMLFRLAEAGRQYMVLTFPVEGTTWWDKPGFPMFIYNVVQYLGGGGADAESGPSRPGDPLRINFPTAKRELELVAPDKRTETIRPDEYGLKFYGATDRAGVYRAKGGVPGRDTFAVNLEDESESDVAPPQDIKIGGQPIGRLDMIKTATPEVWRWFMGAALALVLVEWWVYNRRVAL